MSRKNIKPKTRFAVLRRDGFRCAYCGQYPPKVKLEVDHITPVAHGGENDMFNLITACNVCNIGKLDLQFSEAERFELFERVASNAIAAKRLVVTEADEKRADEIVSIMRAKFVVKNRSIAKHIILLCVKAYSNWEREREWAEQCDSYRHWLNEQYRYLSERYPYDDRGNLERVL